VAGIEDLASLWRSVSSHDVYPLSRAEALRALARNLPLHPLRGVRQALGVANYTLPFHPLTLAEAMFGRHNHMFDNQSLRRFLQRILLIENLEDTQIPLSVLTTDVHSGWAVVLSRGPALPALPASTAIPALYPNVSIGDQVLMDGGISDRTTLDYAVEQGADEVYLLTPASPATCPLHSRPRSPWRCTATTC
jgi:NTE family protein